MDMQDNRILKLVYTFFLGLLLTIFIGVGINTFYPGPKAPEFPVELNTISKEPTQSELATQRQWDKTMQQHEKAMKPYNRNVSLLTLAAAVTLLTISMVFEKKIKLMSDGVMLGGLFTMVYSLGRGFASADSKYVFAVVSVGLAIVIYLGYHRFVRPHGPQAKKMAA